MPPTRPPRRGLIHLAASLGGHLELLTGAREAFAGFDRVWVTSEGAKAEALRAEGERVEVLPRMDRANVAPAAFVRGAALALRERPRVVVTSGAGVVAPFCATSRALGARLIFVETMARVTSGSATGRALARIAHAVAVQWPELRATYPRAVVCRPLLLEDLPGELREGGRGTFVSLGSHDAPFERLTRMVADAAEAGVLAAPVVVQAGVTPAAHPALDVREYVDAASHRELVASSEVVVCHGGAGVMSAAIRAGRRPLVLARSAAHGEHVDDHQHELVRKLASLGLVVELSSAIDRAAVEAARRPPSPPAAADRLPGLVPVLRGLLEG
jgi:UDP-N-acetylglucosamine--N-acetylmuramyl-(pentapeptide) pyrophosphoryl-undecaprenol N-acetylglucosamine transferase